MRIVAGSLRGRPLVAPRGHSTRPTADRTRQAIFNVIEHAAWAPDLEAARVVDLFAGSGAMGIEALSRGAGACLFVENDPAALAAIAANVERLGLSNQARTLRRDAARLGPRSGRDAPFEVAFLDPPYGASLVEAALARLREGDWLAQDALAVVERGADEPGFGAPAGYALLDERVWGAARVSFVRRV
jgi:16S rRNA (guanine966-N2)-methyltransferase